MMKKVLIILFLGVVMTSLNAQSELKKVEHQVEKGQTLYFLSKKYDTSIQDLMRFNPQIGKDMIIKEGMIIKVFSKPTPVLNVVNYNFHVVEKGQTLYSLSKKFNISVDDLIYLNQLENPSISIGQKLIVQNVNKEALFDVSKTIENIPFDNGGSITIEKEVKTERKKEKTEDKTYTSVDPIKENNEKVEKNHKDVEMYKMLYDGFAQSGADMSKEKGIGNFLEQSSSTDVYLALVNDVDNGQVIRVRNLMNNKVLYLKVVGSVPAKDMNSNISIKISSAAARDLNILEDRFLAEWTWFDRNDSQSKVVDKSVRISDF